MVTLTIAVTLREHSMMSSSSGTGGNLQDRHVYVICNDSMCNKTILISLTVALNDVKRSSKTFIVPSSLSQR